MLEEYKDILTVKDVKEILGYKSNNTLYNLLKSGKIQYFRQPNGKYLIPKKGLIDYINSECYNTIHKPFELPIVK